MSKRTIDKALGRLRDRVDLAGRAALLLRTRPRRGTTARRAFFFSNPRSMPTANARGTRVDLKVCKDASRARPFGRCPPIRSGPRRSPSACAETVAKNRSAFSSRSCAQRGCSERDRGPRHSAPSCTPPSPPSGRSVMSCSSSVFFLYFSNVSDHTDGERRGSAPA